MTGQLDPERAKSLLGQAAAQVFAEMAFIDVNPATDAENEPSRKSGNEPQPGEETQCAVIDVMAPLSCRLELRIPAGVRERIVENLFSEMPEAERKKNAEDSILEMLNIIMGNFLSAYFGSGTELQLSLPRYRWLAEEMPGTAVANLRLDAEGSPFELALFSVRYRY